MDDPNDPLTCTEGAICAHRLGAARSRWRAGPPQGRRADPGCHLVRSAAEEVAPGNSSTAASWSGAPLVLRAWKPVGAPGRWVWRPRRAMTGAGQVRLGSAPATLAAAVLAHDRPDHELAARAAAGVRSPTTRRARGSGCLVGALRLGRTARALARGAT